MVVGAAAAAVVALVFVHFVTWAIKSVSWLPNQVGSCIGCGLVIGIGIGLVLTHTVHLILVAVFLVALGVPSLIAVNRWPK